MTRLPVVVVHAGSLTCSGRSPCRLPPRATGLSTSPNVVRAHRPRPVENENHRLPYCDIYSQASAAWVFDRLPAGVDQKDRCVEAEGPRRLAAAAVAMNSENGELSI